MHADDDGDPDDATMGGMTRELADREEPDLDGNTTIAHAEGGAGGASQTDDRHAQPLDSQMAQQGHQLAQGRDGGHADPRLHGRDDDPDRAAPSDAREGTGDAG